jgi:flagellar assembly protein FliH
MSSLSRIIKKNNGAERAQSFDSFFSDESFGEVSEEQHSARAEARAIVEAAREEAERIINDAKKQAICEQQSGFEEGLRRGLDTIKPIEALLHTIVEDFTVFQKNYSHQLEPEVVKMVSDISAKIIKDKLADDQEIVVRTVHAAFQELADKEYIKLRVHADDLARLKEYKQQLLDSFHEIKKFEIVVDDAVDRGGCIIETHEGSIDATIKNQMKKLYGLISCEAVAAQMHIL